MLGSDSDVLLHAFVSTLISAVFVCFLHALFLEVFSRNRRPTPVSLFDVLLQILFGNGLGFLFLHAHQFITSSTGPTASRPKVASLSLDLLGHIVFGIIRGPWLSAEDLSKGSRCQE